MAPSTSEFQHLAKNMLETGFGWDVKIIAKHGRVLLAHHRFLRSSPVLAAELQEQTLLEAKDKDFKGFWNPAPSTSSSAAANPTTNNRTLHMEKWTKGQVEEFLSFLYLGELTMAKEIGPRAIALYEMGLDFDVPSLTNSIKDILVNMSIDRFTKDNAVSLFTLSSRSEIHAEELEKKALEVYESARESGKVTGGQQNSETKAVDPPELENFWKQFTEETTTDEARRRLLENAEGSDLKIRVKYRGVVHAHQRLLEACPNLMMRVEQLPPSNRANVNVNDNDDWDKGEGQKVNKNEVDDDDDADDGPMETVLLMENWTKPQVLEFLSYLYFGATPKALGDMDLAIALYEMGLEYDLPSLATLMHATVMDMETGRFKKEDATRLFFIASSVGSEELGEKAAAIHNMVTANNIKTVNNSVWRYEPGGRGHFDMRTPTCSNWGQDKGTEFNAGDLDWNPLPGETNHEEDYPVSEKVKQGEGDKNWSVSLDETNSVIRKLENVWEDEEDAEENCHDGLLDEPNSSTTKPEKAKEENEEAEILREKANDAVSVSSDSGREGCPEDEEDLDSAKYHSAGFKFKEEGSNVRKM